ncbi:hypothetical protein SAMN05421770_107110 [Granulicella rosea]|uniref:Uncharacterized protein n=1 Tax=Granulicella rosea TaxID=474952 RepID=A0A239LML9_9BACT|nr:hypothetical protein [Granulicella rosea]SNT31142.1 hypothetical protein SAMN05421770_107110 [Granulicella rosea]
MRSALSLVLVSSLAFAAPALHAQAAPANPQSCPVQPVKFDPSGLSVRIENTSGKMIVGMTWFAAIADGTEHWNWIFWNIPGPLRLREFNWNKEIKPGSKKTLSWPYEDLNFQHASGGAFILGSVLFADGSRWEQNPQAHTCQAVWLNGNKRMLTRPEELPPSQ